MMKIKLRLLGFRNRPSRFDEEAVAVPSGSSIRSLLEMLRDEQGLGASKGIADEDLLILIGGRNIRQMEGLDTSLTEGDVISVLRPTAGG